MREAFAGRALLMWTTLVVPAGLIWVLGVVVLLQLHPDALTDDVTPFFRVLNAGLVSGGWTCAGFAGAGLVLLLARGWGWWLGRRSRMERERFDASVAQEAVLDAPSWEAGVSREE